MKAEVILDKDFVEKLSFIMNEKGIGISRISTAEFIKLLIDEEYRKLEKQDESNLFFDPKEVFACIQIRMDPDLSREFDFLLEREKKRGLPLNAAGLIRLLILQEYAKHAPLANTSDVFGNGIDEMQSLS